MLEKLLKLFKSEAGLTRIVKDINALEPELIKLSDQSIKERGRQLREGVEKGRNLDDALPGAFALVRETAK